jgi:2-octaprenyl-6-methoxyphenol hydroxylase
MAEATDLLVVGGGPVGMATALAASRLGLSVRLLDASAGDAWRKDPRAIALSDGSRQLLARLGAWPIAGSTPIREVVVSQAGSVGRTRLTAAENRLQNLGEVVAYGALCEALAGAIERAGDAIARVGNARVDACRADHRLAMARVGDRDYPAGLLVHAEGAATPESLYVDYAQDALLARVQPASTHANCAWERFTPQGPVALLPQGEAFAVVFVVPRGGGSDLEFDDQAFLAALAARFDGQLAFTRCEPRQRVPLALRVRPRLVEGRQIWLGNAAQSLHPISGQGLNLGLRDAACLIELLARHADGDLAAAAAGYGARRCLDRSLTVAFTDLLARLFVADSRPIAAARGAALTAIGLCAPARRALAGQMIFGHRA